MPTPKVNLFYMHVSLLVTSWKMVDTLLRRFSDPLISNHWCGSLKSFSKRLRPQSPRLQDSFQRKFSLFVADIMHHNTLMKNYLMLDSYSRTQRLIIIMNRWQDKLQILISFLKIEEREVGMKITLQLTCIKKHRWLISFEAKILC